MSTPQQADRREERILILAPSRRDAPTVARFLAAAGLDPEIVSDIGALCDGLREGAGAVLLVDEAIRNLQDRARLIACLENQEPWSEPPIVVAVATAANPAMNGQGGVNDYGNVVLLERPLRSAVLVSAMQSALRSRRRQYEVRDYLRERERSERRLREQEKELRLLNQTLEERVRERTSALEAAHARLTEEMAQRQEAERNLRQAQKMEAVGQLTGGIAHDFNNLLMVVTGGLNMLDRTDDPARRERLIGGIRQAAARGEALTRQLMAFSRRIALSPEPIEMTGLIEGMRSLLAGSLRENIEVSVEIADGLWPVMADRNQLELAILNTAVNARDAMPSGGRLVISASNVTMSGAGGLNGDFVRIEIRDNGSGIPAHLLDRVFEPFFTTKDVGKGTGLGLSQVYGFAHQSGGRAEVRSVQGDGTGIILYLPRAAHPAVGRDVAATSAPLRRARLGEGRTVLLVEDNDAVASVVGEMLADLGFAVRRVATAAEALSALGEGMAPDLVFSDIVMPGRMDGIGLAHEVARSQPDLPVVLTTGYSEAARHLDRAGSLQLISKPYSLDALEGRLREIFPH